jgi:hypothetical protein
MGFGNVVDGTEQNMNKQGFLKFWSIGAGLMDALTGLLLVVAPEVVLGLLRIAPPSQDALVFVSWIGVFVLGVGVSYGFALGRDRGRGEAVWMFTAVVRLLVAGFLTWKTASGALSSAWVVVALSDAGVAAVQLVIVALGWWKEERR